MPKAKRSILVEPSLLSADFGHLAAEAERAASAGADALHIDVMDGHFVRNLALSARATAALNRATDLFLDVHLMVYNPFDYIEPFVQAGADRITFHLEATEDIEDTLQYILRCNIKAGLALCPETSASLILKYLDQFSLILLMTVSPGFGGQAFLPEVLKKIEFVRKACEQLKLSTHIQVDGGIDEKTAAQCIHAGADILVSGSYLFGAPDMHRAIETLRGL